MRDYIHGALLYVGIVLLAIAIAYVIGLFSQHAH
jgi:hypothetical protein